MKFFLLLILVFTHAALAGSFKVLMDGKPFKEFTESEIRALKPVEVSFYNGVSKRVEPYRGVNLRALFYKEIEGKHNIVEVEFRSQNGFRSYFSLQLAKNADPILAYERADGQPFSRYSVKEKQLVSLAPYYVVWDMSNLPLQQQALYNSIYQVVEVNLITSAVNFGIDQIDATDGIDLGYRTYKRYCLSCHAIDKWGGNLGIDIVKHEVLRKKGEDYIIRYALDPSSVNPKTKMLPLPAFRNREEMAQGLIEFIKFVTMPDEYILAAKKAGREPKFQNLSQIIKEVKAKP